MKKIIIDTKNSGQRIDKFLIGEVFFSSKISRGEIIRNIKAGNILLNSKKTKPSILLKENDEIKIDLKEKNEKLLPNAKLKIPILHQDKNIVVLNKPAGLSVHPTSFEEKNTLVNFLVYKFPEIENVNDGSQGSEMRPGIVHRLDKDTTGVMVVARNQKTFNTLKKLFQERKVSKKYVALVVGKLEKEKIIVDKPLARSADYKKQIIANKKTKTKIRSAVTEVEVLREFNGYSLVEVSPKTGRMHQIRVHLASLGNPIIGDAIYNKNKINNSVFLAARQMLHAASLEFEMGSKKYVFSAPLPKDIRDAAGGLTEKL